MAEKEPKDGDGSGVGRSRSELFCGGPMLTQLVLEKIFDVCTVEDLANYRLVCKEWFHSSLRKWRETAQLVVVDYIGKPRKAEYRERVQLEALMELVADPNVIYKLSVALYQYRSFKLEGWYLTNHRDSMIHFWSAFQTAMTRLELVNVRVDAMNTLLAVLYRRTPNLESLTLDKVDVIGGTQESASFHCKNPQVNLKVLRVRRISRFPVNWETFFGHFPNLEWFEWFNTKSDSVLVHMLQGMIPLRVNDKKLMNLKQLALIRGDSRHRCVQTTLSPAIHQHLQTLQFPLESLELKFGCRSTSGISFSVLQLYATTLKRLKFVIDFKSTGRFPYGALLDELEELELGYWCGITNNLDMLKSMPKLKSLRVQGIKNLFHVKKHGDEAKANVDEDLIQGDWMDPVYGMKTEIEEFSNVHDSSPPIEKSYLLHVMRIMPKLTKLEMKLNNDTFRLVCKNLPTLSELRIYGRRIDDYGITGRQRRVKCKKEDTPLYHPNITDLKELRVFVIHDRSHILGNASIFHGFLKVPSLFTLKMVLTPKINSKAREALEKAIPNLIIYPSPGKNGKEKADKKKTL